MIKTKTYSSEELKLKKLHDSKLFSLKRRIEVKYEWKIEKEYERKKARLDKELERKLHNLKIELAVDNRKRVVRIKKPKKTDYANACEIAQLLAKLIYTNPNGVWECICCPWEFCSWDLLDWWHRIPKAKSRLTALDPRNIHPQKKSCNSSRGGKGNYHLQIEQINKLHWAGTTDLLLEQAKNGEKWNMEEYIRLTLPTIEKFLNHKTFDTSKEKERVRLRKKRYVKDNDTK